MKLSHKTVMAVMFLFLTGCAIKHDYRWREYPLAKDRICTHVHFTESQELRIIKGKSDDSKISLASAMS